MLPDSDGRNISTALSRLSCFPFCPPLVVQASRNTVVDLQSGDPACKEVKDFGVYKLKFREIVEHAVHIVLSVALGAAFRLYPLRCPPLVVVVFLPPVKVWTLLCDISRKEFQKVYDRLGVTLEEHGESFYNDMIPSTIDMLAEAGLISRDDGADIVRLEHFTYPLIVRKRDGERW